MGCLVPQVIIPIHASAFPHSLDAVYPADEAQSNMPPGTVSIDGRAAPAIKGALPKLLGRNSRKVDKPPFRSRRCRLTAESTATLAHARYIQGIICNTS